MSDITINIIQARLRTIHEFMRKKDTNQALTLILASDRLWVLMQDIQKHIEKHPPKDELDIEAMGEAAARGAKTGASFKELLTEDKSLEESILRSKAWIVTEGAIVAFSSNGIFNVTIDGCHLASGKYLGKKKEDEITWYRWLKERRKNG